MINTIDDLMMVARAEHAMAKKIQELGGMHVEIEEYEGVQMECTYIGTILIEAHAIE